MTQRIRPQGQSGFTLVELLMAISFISFILLFIVFAMLQVMGNYNKGIAIKDINQTARSLVEDISRLARSTNAEAIDVSKVTTDGRLCFGGVAYVWNVREAALNKYFGTSEKVTMARVEDSEVCKTPLQDIPKAKSISVLSDQVWVQKVDAKLLAGGKLLSITVRLSTANDNRPTELGSDGNYTCSGSTTGNYCAVSEFSTTVSTRNGGE